MFIVNFIWRKVKYLICGIGIKEGLKCVFLDVLVCKGDIINVLIKFYVFLF